MQLIGFSFKKILAKKSPVFKKSTINTNIEFIEVKKEKIPFIKENETAKISYTYSVTYTTPDKKEEKNAEISFDGEIILSLTKKELEDLLSSWEKKNLSEEIKFPLFNLILKKCSAKALSLEDDLNLPYHIPIPQVKKQESS